MQESVRQHHTGAQTEMMGFVLALQDLKCERHTHRHAEEEKNESKNESGAKRLYSLCPRHLDP